MRGRKRVYEMLWHHLAAKPFRVRDLSVWLPGTRAARAMSLTRMVSRGQVVRISRGRYSTVSPGARAGEIATGWPDRIRSPLLRRVLRLGLTALTEELGDRLESVALFGSYSRGSARSFSDVDLLVVTDSRLSVSAEARVAARLRGAVTELLVGTWRVQGVHPAPQPVFVSGSAVRRGFSFLLDLTADAVILYDREGALRGSLARLRKRAVRLGVRRVELSHGRRYWAMPPGTPLSELPAGASTTPD